MRTAWFDKHALIYASFPTAPIPAATASTTSSLPRSTSQAVEPKRRALPDRHRPGRTWMSAATKQYDGYKVQGGHFNELNWL